MARMSIIFDGFKDLAYKIDEAGGDLHAAVDEALTETQFYIQNEVEKASIPYAHGGLKGYATGKMANSIVADGVIHWTGTVAEVRVGYDLHQAGGFHSIFVMYGTPKMTKDQKVYDAIRGTKTKKDIARLQQGIMEKYLKIGD